MALVEQGVCSDWLQLGQKLLKLDTEFLKTRYHDIGRFLVLLAKAFTREGENSNGISR